MHRIRSDLCNVVLIVLLRQRTHLNNGANQEHRTAGGSPKEEEHALAKFGNPNDRRQAHPLQG